MSEAVRLSMVDIETYRHQGQGRQCGKCLRFFCPVHGGDHQRSLSLDPETGRFHCFSCDAWGYLEERREEWSEKRRQEWREEHGRNVLGKRACQVKKAAEITQDATSEPVARPEILPVLAELQQSLVGSLGEQYLHLRRISLALAQSLGVGYAAYGKWPHMKDGRPVRQWKWGRVVFPHTNPLGEVVSLYGRAVGRSDKVPKAERHDHLPLAKGVFNAKALRAETVFICEGVFNAMSLMEAGCPNACAIFGVYGLRWEWLKAKRLVFCLDQDKAGQTAWHELAWEGTTRGLDVYWLPAEVYGGYKDLNEVWTATGKLEIGDWL
jgi:hypothetical protein